MFKALWNGSNTIHKLSEFLFQSYYCFNKLNFNPYAKYDKAYQLPLYEILWGPRIGIKRKIVISDVVQSKNFIKKIVSDTDMNVRWKSDGYTTL